MSDRILSVIPARKGSKGIPRKNLRKLGEHPLVAHAVRASKRAEAVDEVALTTDSCEIAEIGRQYGVDTTIDRPERLATDEVPLAPVVAHALDSVSTEFDYVLCFQPTAPLVSAQSITGGIRIGLKNDAESVVFVRDSTHYYWKETEDGYKPLASDRKNRQWMDSIYEEIGVFLTHHRLVTDERRVGDDPVLHEVSQTEGIDIDTHADWLLAENQRGREQIVYRVSGTDEFETGQLRRAITIADHTFSHDILFSVESEDESMLDKIDDSNYEYRVLDGDDSFLEYVRATRPEVVVNDISDTTKEYIRKLKETGARVVNFWDSGTGAQNADAVINAQQEHSSPPANHYYGFKYFCLRDQFRYTTPRTAIPSVDRIVIYFRNNAESGLTAKTLRALVRLDHEVQVDVVLDTEYTDRKRLQSIVDGTSSNVTVEFGLDVRSVARKMQVADLLITSNGTSLHEAGSLNLPAISIARNHCEQKRPYADISRGVLSLGYADCVTESDIETTVRDYIEDGRKREAMRGALAGQDIAGGVTRIKQILFEEPL